MNPTRLGALSVLLLLPACGSSISSQGQQSRVTDHPAASPFFVAAATPGIYHAHLNMAFPVGQTTSCGDSVAGAPTSLADRLKRIGPAQPIHAAAIVTILAVEPAVWNTPDGHRWTQAEIDAGTVVDPSVYTPFVLRVQVPLSSGLSVDQTVRGFLRGGRTSFGDTVQACDAPVVEPQVGWSAVVMFGGEVDSYAAVLHHPTIIELDPIQSGAVQTRGGPQPIP